MIIDANIYWIPEALFSDENLRRRFFAPISSKTSQSGYYGYMYTNSAGVNEITIEKPQGFQNLNYLQGEYITAVQLEDMDAAGIDKALLKTPCCQEWMDLDMCRYFNDGMAMQVAESNGRLAALAVVPPYASPDVLNELRRCIEELGFHGVQMSAHYGERYLDDESFGPIFEYLNNMGITVYVHHTPLPVGYSSFLDYTSLRRSYGRCVDQTVAVCRELYSGMFDKYANLKMVHSMLGGGIFSILPMLMPHGSEKDKINRFANQNSNFEVQLKNNIYFEVSHAQPWGKEQLECAVKTLGADHIIYGSSYPVKKVWFSGGPDFIGHLDITEEEKELILSGNARRLYNM